MLESTIEKYLVKEVWNRGGRALKWVSPGMRGVPDRIVFLPQGIVFCELKQPRKRADPHQARVHKMLGGIFRIVPKESFVWVVDSKESVDAMLKYMDDQPYRGDIVVCLKP